MRARVKKWAAIAAAAICTAASVCCALLPSPRAWREVSVSMEQGDRSSFLLSPMNGSGDVRLLSAQTDEAEEFELTATVKDEEGAEKTGAKVDWSISFCDSSDEWAQGKRATDYVEVIPDSDGARHATVRCLQPFGARIKVEAVVRGASNLRAECICDYAKRVKSFNGYFRIVDEVAMNPYFCSGDITFSELYCEPNRDYEIVYDSIEYEPFTVDQDLSFNAGRSFLSLTQQFIDKFVPYAISHRLCNENIRARLLSLNAATQEPMYTGTIGDIWFLGSGIPGSVYWNFPVLTKGLDSDSMYGDATTLGEILEEWLNAGNSKEKIVCSHYYFEGSEKDFTFVCEQGFAWS